MKLEKEQRIREQLAEEAAAEKRDPALKRQRIMSGKPSTNVWPCGGAQLRSRRSGEREGGLAREYCVNRELIDRQEAIREIEELERRKREIAERVSVCDDPDDIFPDWRVAPSW